MKRLLTIGVVALFLAGCGDDSGGPAGTKSCTQLCTEAQAGSCTAVKGDCSKFCAAIDALSGPAGCAQQKSAYQSCLSSKPAVCGSSCGTEETAVRNCYVKYCLTKASDASCLTLATSF